MTNRQQIEHEITGLLEKMKHHSNNSDTNDTEGLNALLNDARELYEQVIVLKALNEQPQEEEEEEEPVIEPVSIQEQESSSTVDEDSQLNEPEVTLSTDENEASNPDLFSNDSEPESKAEESESTVNDLAASQHEPPSVAVQLENKSINDLESAIGVNEKFLFINELFQGNADEYGQAMIKLNQCSNISEAESIVKDELHSKYNWEPDNKAPEILLGLLAKRYSA